MGDGALSDKESEMYEIICKTDDSGATLERPMVVEWCAGDLDFVVERAVALGAGHEVRSEFGRIYLGTWGPLGEAYGGPDDWTEGR
jgi:hypothetical protein